MKQRGKVMMHYRVISNLY